MRWTRPQEEPGDVSQAVKKQTQQLCPVEDTTPEEDTYKEDVEEE